MPEPPAGLPVTEVAKWAAGTEAATLVEAGMRLGLGTGSTVRWFLEALAARGLDVAGVPTSRATTDRCRELGIRLLDPADVERLDLAVDGADEFTADLTATKGGGGALLREKVVATLADRFVLVATPEKAVALLGVSFPLPVEVIPFAASPVARSLGAGGGLVQRRRDEEGTPFVTDNGNAILDVTYPEGIVDPAATAVAIDTTPGVVTCGLFVRLAEQALLGHPDGQVEHRTPG